MRRINPAGTLRIEGSLVAAVGKDRAARDARERARLYEARREFHGSQGRRRSRDNLVAGIAGGVLILIVLGGQLAYYTLGPGTPEPAPSPSATTTPAVVTPTPTSSAPAAVTPSPTTTP